MNWLTLYTTHPNAVLGLLQTEALVERANLPREIHQKAGPGPNDDAITMLDIKYRDDLLSQVLVYWLAMAQGCGLITEWEFQEGTDREVKNE